MKSPGIILLLLMLLPATYSQTEETVNKKTQKQLVKEEKKKQQEILLAKQSSLVDWMINSRKFVLEANYLSNQYGNRIIVSSNLNFILVDSLRGSIQIASASGVGGPNRMGGVTADGSISQYEVTKNAKSGSYSIKMMIMTSLGSYDIFFTISSDGTAYATIGGNWGGKLNYQGRLVPLGVSRVYKAPSI
jgi:hypothetical protein